MNWTGGRLQRHSNANANPLVKAQRDHFARARFGFNNKPAVPSPLSFSTKKAQQRKSKDPELTVPRQRQRYIDDRQEKTSPTTHNQYHRWSGADAGPALAETNNYKKRRVSGRARLSTTPDANTLDEVRQKLLKRSDWMGLIDARPAKINFIPKEELENVGRRRIVTAEDRKRKKYGTGRRQVEHNLIKPFQNLREYEAGPLPQSENISIRFGSNIHQSQAAESPHQFQRTSPGVTESVSTDSMLLDKLETEFIVDPVAPTCREELSLQLEMHMESDEGEKGDFETTGLIPLSQARSFTNFDEVKKHFSSTSRGSFTSSLSLPTTSLRPVATRKALQQAQLLSPLLYTHDFLSSGQSSKNVEVQIQQLRNITETQVTSIDTSPAATVNVSGVTQSKQKPSTRGKPNGVDSFVNNSLLRANRASKSYGRKRKYTDPQDEDGPPLQYNRPSYTIEHQVELEVKLQRQKRIIKKFSKKDKNMIHSIQCEEPQKFLSFNSATSSTTGQPQAGGDDPDRWDMSSTGFHSVRVSAELPRKFSQQSMSSDEQRSRSTHESGNPVVKGSSKQKFPRPHHTNRKEGSLNAPSRHDLVHISGRARPIQNLKLPDGPTGLRTQSDETEAFLRDVFPEDFVRMQKGFVFGKPPRMKSGKDFPSLIARYRALEEEQEAEKAEKLHLRIAPSQQILHSSPTRSIRTAANTVMNFRGAGTLYQAVDMSQPSDTDFLTQMSPMEGYLDERIADISVYNNAARTERSFIPAPTISTKGSVLNAFSDNQTDKCLQYSLPEGAHFYGDNPHRKPLQTLHQPINRREASTAPYVKHRMEWEQSRPCFWQQRRKQAPMSFDDSSSSNERLETMQTPQKRPSDFPITYMSRGNQGPKPFARNIVDRYPIQIQKLRYSPISKSHASPSLSIAKHHVAIASNDTADPTNLCEDDLDCSEWNALAAAATSDSAPDSLPSAPSQVSQGQSQNQPRITASTSFPASMPRTSSSSAILHSSCTNNRNHINPSPVPNIHTAQPTRPFPFKHPSRPGGNGQGNLSRPHPDAVVFRQPDPIPTLY